MTAIVTEEERTLGAIVAAEAGEILKFKIAWMNLLPGERNAVAEFFFPIMPKKTEEKPEQFLVSGLRKLSTGGYPDSRDIKPLLEAVLTGPLEDST